MERRYLVAALAIIATFAVFSRGLRTLERVSLLYGPSTTASEVQCRCCCPSHWESADPPASGLSGRGAVVGRNEPARRDGTSEGR